MDRLATKG